MADRKIVDLPTSQTLSDTDYMLVNQNGTPVWVVTDKMKQNAVNAVKHPDTLPNPKKLKFTGAVTAEYDGSTEQTINIPAGGTGGTSDYNALSNKPQVNNVELSGNKTLDDLGIQEKIASVVENKVQFDKEISTSKVSATTVEGDNLYDKTTIDGKLGAKLDKNQGSVNQGKFLSVGSDGNVQLVEAPSGGGGSDYTLPQATENALGGIKAKAKTDETVEVAIDSASGKLYVPTYPTPSGGGSSENEWKLINDITLSEQVRNVVISEDSEQSPLLLTDVFVMVNGKSDGDTAQLCYLKINNTFFANVFRIVKNSANIASNLNNVSSAILLRPILIGGSSNNSYGGVASSLSMQCGNVFLDKSITKIEVGLASASRKFEVGSNIKVYGR